MVCEFSCEFLVNFLVISGVNLCVNFCVLCEYCGDLAWWCCEFLVNFVVNFLCDFLTFFQSSHKIPCNIFLRKQLEIHTIFPCCICWGRQVGRPPVNSKNVDNGEAGGRAGDKQGGGAVGSIPPQPRWYPRPQYPHGGVKVSGTTPRGGAREGGHHSICKCGRREGRPFAGGGWSKASGGQTSTCCCLPANL
jgi:hypothetical protein